MRERSGGGQMENKKTETEGLKDAQFDQGDIFRSRAHLPSNTHIHTPSPAYIIHMSLNIACWIIPFFFMLDIALRRSQYSDAERMKRCSERRKAQEKGGFPMTHGIDTIRISAWWKTNSCIQPYFKAEVEVCVCVYLGIPLLLSSNYTQIHTQIKYTETYIFMPNYHPPIHMQR